MRKLLKIIMIYFLMMTSSVYADDELKSISFDDYLKRFDNSERRDMKIRIPELLELYQQKKVQIIDIRTLEKHEEYHLKFIRHIPINELPERLVELDKSKIIVTVCTNYDRAEMVRMYLILKGFSSKYLVDGMVGLSEYMRRGYGKEFYQ